MFEIFLSVSNTSGFSRSHAVEAEEVLVLRDQGVLRLGHHPHELGHPQVLNGGDHGQAANELGDEAELVQVLGADLGGEDVLLLPGQDPAEAERLRP